MIVNAIQCLVSLNRIEAYLALPEVDDVLLSSPPSDNGNDEEDALESTALGNDETIAFNSATVTWPSIRTAEEKMLVESGEGSTDTPGGQRFELQDLSISFPIGKLTIISGSIGSGKTLLLLCTFPFVVPFSLSPSDNFASLIDHLFKPFHSTPRGS